MGCGAQSANKIDSKYESRACWVYFSYKWETVVIMQAVIHVIMQPSSIGSVTDDTAWKEIVPLT